MAEKLPRLNYKAPIAGKEGLPTFQFHRDFDAFAKAIETSLSGLAEAIAAVAAAQDAADAANTAAAAANAAADTATSVAQITSSGVSGATLTGTDAGTDATVSISAHTRIYGDGTSVSVNSGSVTALAYSTLYYVYYDQASRAGGAVTYQATTSQTTAAQTGDRHLVGQVTTPAAAAPDTDGKYVGAPGVGGIYE